jgi:putative membrane protein
VTTLVVCVDRSDGVGRTTGHSTPVAGWEAVRSLVIDVGLVDPEDSAVNSLLEGLRVARDLQDEEDEEAVVAVVSGSGDSVVSADRAVARQMDELMAEYAPDSAIVVIDSAEDERLVPIVESRVRVDSVDRVVVRQARDIESTYYLLKQFLADEELRQTVLVPIGVALVVFPALSMFAGPTIGVATITAVIGLFLLYKGFGIDDRLARFAAEVREALYSGQISVVTYVIAAGLTLAGVFAGALGVSGLPAGIEGVFVPAMQFAFDSVLWLTMAALAASTGRVLDEAIQEESVPTAFLNLPFFAVAVGLVVRGFSGYFLQRGAVVGPIEVPPLVLGALRVEGFALQAGERLAVFVLVGILVSIVGVRVAARFSGTSLQESDLPDTGS